MPNTRQENDDIIQVEDIEAELFYDLDDEYREDILTTYFRFIGKHKRLYLRTDEINGYIWMVNSIKANPELLEQYKKVLRKRSALVKPSSDTCYSLFYDNSTSCKYIDYIQNKISALNELGEQELYGIAVNDYPSIVSKCNKVICEYEKKENKLIEQIKRTKEVLEKYTLLLCNPELTDTAISKFKALKQNLERMEGTLSSIETKRKNYEKHEDKRQKEKNKSKRTISKKGSSKKDN